MTAYEGQNLPDNFLPTTANFPSDPDHFSNRLHETYVDIARNVNSREISLYELTELVTGQTFFDKSNNQNRRYAYRKCFTFGVIASGGTLNIPHGISNVPSVANPTGKTIFTNIYGTYLDNSYYQKPVAYSVFGPAFIGYQFDIKIDDTNIILVNGTAGTAVATISGIVILEYLKN